MSSSNEIMIKQVISEIKTVIPDGRNRSRTGKISIRKEPEIHSCKHNGTGSCTLVYRWSLRNACELGTRTKMHTWPLVGFQMSKIFSRDFLGLWRHQKITFILRHTTIQNFCFAGLMLTKELCQRC